MVVLAGPAQGTTYRVVLPAAETHDPAALEALVKLELARLDQSLSNYRGDSQIEQFNRWSSTEPFPAGEEIVKLIATAASVSRSSRGCYDLTAGPLVDLWGFKGDALRVPVESELRSVMKTSVGHEKLVVVDAGALQKRSESLKVDLSSIAQGYSVARLANILREQGIENYLVEIGGELQARGTKPSGKPWRVAIERPIAKGRELLHVLELSPATSLALMTSGTYRHFYLDEGRRLSHIIDARTGHPVEHATVSVTVAHIDATLADAWATALLCLGVPEGLRTANAEDIAALFVEQQERDGALRETASRGWQERGLTPSVSTATGKTLVKHTTDGLPGPI